MHSVQINQGQPAVF